MRARRSQSGSDRRERSLVLLGAGLVVFAILIARLFYLQVVTSERSRELAERNWLRPEFVPGPRGRILDRDGVVLAEMIPSFVIGLDPQNETFLRHRDRLDSTLVLLAELAERDPRDFRELLEREGRASYKPVRLIRNADSLVVARVEEHRYVLPGVSVDVEPTRRYPSDSLASHVLGYIGEVGEKDLEKLADRGYRPGSLIGKTGIELQYEELLRGEDGQRYVEVNALGRRSEAFNRREPVAPRPGRDVRLTLDAEVQRAAERALDLARYDGTGVPPEVRGAAILMDVRTGEILALASRPGFDINVFSGTLTQAEWSSLNRESRPLLNRAIQASYPPGSVFKPFTEYAVLTQGIVAPGQYLSPCFGRHRFGNRTFHCWKRSGHGALDDVGAMAHSCDVYFYQLAPSLGVDGIEELGELFDLSGRTGIDLPQERGGLIPSAEYYDERYGKKQWSPGLTLNLIIGQGEILLTPVALTRALGVLATGGKQVTPRLLLDVGEEKRRLQYADPPAPPSSVPAREIPLDPRALGRVRRGMRAAVEEGTAKAAQVHGIEVAGKTGTAQNPGFDHALFTAYAPAESPEVVVVVILENRGHGGSVAAPVAQRILSAYFEVPDSLLTSVAETD